MKHCCLICLFLFLAGGINPVRAQTPVAQHGQLGIMDGRIVDRYEKPPQLKGISFSWSIWAGKKYYNKNVVKWLCKDFNVSLIRASMAVQPAGGYLEYPAEQQQLITTVVDEAIKNGIYVLIDWHDHHAEQHTEQAKLFFVKMAKRYAGRPNVIYEIWNEPERQSWPVIRQYATEVIREIRKYDPLNLIVVGSPHWDQDVDIAAADPVTGFKNLAYSFHFYATDPGHQDTLRAKADLAVKKGLPLFVTEWGVGEADGNGAFDMQKTEKWLSWMEANKLSWANWNITDKKETTALLLPGAAANGGWKVSELTPAGVYIRTVLRNQLPGKSADKTKPDKY